MSLLKMTRLTKTLLALIASAFVHAAVADDSIKILVGFPAGGGTDAIARTLADKLKEQLGVSVVVENKAGAGGQIAAQVLKTAAPDGKTFFLTHDHTISILPQVVKNPGFDPARDFVPVAGFASFVNVFAVSGATPAKSMSDYAAWVQKQNNAKSAVGVPAPASVPEFLVSMIGRHYKLDLVAAPYRGSAPLIADMLGNQISAGIASLPDFIQNHQAGKLRVIAVMGRSHQSLVPGVPTFAELGVAGFEDIPYYGFFAPAGTPQATLNQFASALERVLAMPDVREKLVAMGLAVKFETQAQFTQRERAYTQAWERIIKASGFQAQ